MARVEKFLGLRNTVVPKRQPPGALARAVNVDLDDSGALVRRSGSTRVWDAMARFRSVYAMRHQQAMFVVDADQLYRVESRAGAFQPVESPLGSYSIPEGQVFWAEAGDFVFISTGGFKGVIVNGALYPWGVEAAPEPTVYVSASGNLPRGLYQVAAARVDGVGRHGPASEIVQVDIGDAGGALRIEVAPGCRAYVSGCNGETLYHSPGTVLEAPYQGAYRLDPAQIGTFGPPPGDVIEYAETKLWVAVHDPSSDTTTVFASKPFWWHLFDLAADYLQVPGRVLGMARCNEELIIATDRDVWRYASNATPDLLRLRRFGAIPGYPVTLLPPDPPHQPYETVLIWTVKGWFRYSPEIPLGDDLTRDIYQMPPGSTCSTAFLERGGSRYALAITTPGDAPAYGL